SPVVLGGSGVSRDVLHADQPGGLALRGVVRRRRRTAGVVWSGSPAVALLAVSIAATRPRLDVDHLRAALSGARAGRRPLVSPYTDVRGSLSDHSLDHRVAAGCRGAVAGSGGMDSDRVGPRWRLGGGVLRRAHRSHAL